MGSCNNLLVLVEGPSPPQAAPTERPLALPIDLQPAIDSKVNDIIRRSPAAVHHQTRFFARSRAEGAMGSTFSPLFAM